MIVGADGEIEYTLHHTEPVGFFGVSRDKKMVGYFKRLHMPASIAIASLYGFAVFEILIGIGFLLLAGWSLLPRAMRRRKEGVLGWFADRTIHRLCFKGGIVVFIAFSIGDILFGDRMELWEHGTFMLLTLVTYDLWYRTDQFVQGSEKDAAVDEAAVA